MLWKQFDLCIFLFMLLSVIELEKFAIDRLYHDKLIAFSVFLVFLVLMCNRKLQFYFKQVIIICYLLLTQRRSGAFPSQCRPPVVSPGVRYKLLRRPQKTRTRVYTERLRTFVGDAGSPYSLLTQRRRCVFLGCLRTVLRSHLYFSNSVRRERSLATRALGASGCGL